MCEVGKQKIKVHQLEVLSMTEVSEGPLMPNRWSPVTCPPQRRKTLSSESPPRPSRVQHSDSAAANSESLSQYSRHNRGQGLASTQWTSAMWERKTWVFILRKGVKDTQVRPSGLGLLQPRSQGDSWSTMRLCPQPQASWGKFSGNEVVTSKHFEGLKPRILLREKNILSNNT